MDIKPILDAARGVELALSKFTTVLQEANDNNIFAINDAELPSILTPSMEGKGIHPSIVKSVTPSTPVAPALDIASVTVGELDDEGIPHDQRIHSDKPSLVNSKEVKGGRAYRRKKGLDDATYDTIKAELKAQYAGVTPAPVSVAVLDEPVPTTPSLPAAPSAPSAPAPAPAAPLAPVVNTDDNAELRKECIGIIKQLTETHGLTFEDCKEVLVEEFKVAQNGDEITFGSIKISQYEAVRDYFLTLRTEYETAENYVTEIRELAGAANAGLIDEGLLQILSAYNTAEIGGVHYASVKALNETLAGWHKTYVDWKAGQ